MLLAIDTSTETASLALAQDETVLAEFTWRTGQNHTTQLSPNIDYLFKMTGTAAKDLTAVIAAKGPGSFNGLRVGISVAKGLAFGLGIPLIGINSLEAAAFQYAVAGLPVCAVFNAGRNEIAVAKYRKSESNWQQLAAEYITTVEKLCSETDEATLFCGDYISHVETQLKDLLKEKAVIASPLTDLRRAVYLLELGRYRLESGDTDNPATLQAIYLRRPPITKAKHL